jgi:hypothetical protein
VVDLCETHNVSTVTIRKDFFRKWKITYIERMGSKQKPVYAFERNVDDEMQVEQKQIAEEVKIHK